MLQSNAAVFCGDQTRSYYGTTIQVVQPNPALTVACTHQHVTAEEMPIATAPPQACQLPLGITNTDKRVHSNSPASSPHSLGKDGPKRKRTLSPHTFKLSEKIKPIQDTLPINALSWNDFIESDEEQHERVSFECNMFVYNTLKHACIKCNNGILLALQNVKKFISCINYIPQTQPSIIHYLELVDETADSEDTLLHISLELQEKLKTIYFMTNLVGNILTQRPSSTKSVKNWWVTNTNALHSHQHLLCNQTHG